MRDIFVLQGEEETQRHTAHLRALVEATVKAEELVKRGRAPAGLNQVLNDLGWTSEPMAREVMVPKLLFAYSF